MTRLDTRSFLRGFGRAFDLGGATVPSYTRQASWHRSDRDAIDADWQAVWGDMDRAYHHVRKYDASPGT
jgi:hypothetical protein